ncbi:hypothetical protein L1887_18841 [Cichorium endivia]|nr:hypothetical protein L1887_18841 [Cichorium endivia]
MADIALLMAEEYEKIMKKMSSDHEDLELLPSSTVSYGLWMKRPRFNKLASFASVYVYDLIPLFFLYAIKLYVICNPHGVFKFTPTGDILLNTVFDPIEAVFKEPRAFKDELVSLLLNHPNRTVNDSKL